MLENYPIDMVYLWCDGSDPDFRARKNYYQKKKGYSFPILTPLEKCDFRIIMN
jgi:hypothetical protein